MNDGTTNANTRRPSAPWTRYSSLLVCASLLFLLFPHSTVQADGPELRCRSGRALAEAKAQLLYAPTLRLMFSHQPHQGDNSPDESLGEAGYQVRPLVSFSPLDLVRASRILRAADAACAADRAAQPVAVLLMQGVHYGRASALHHQIEYIEQQAGRIDDLLEASRQRRERQIDTVLEEDELVLRALRLQRLLAAARQDVALLEAQDFDQQASPTNWDSIRRYEDEIHELDRVQSTLRRLSAWDVNLQVGPVPGDPWDWYGLVSFNVDLGGVGQVRAERRYLEARGEEIRGDETELRGRLSELHTALEASAAEVVNELELVDRQLEVIERERGRLHERAGDSWQHVDAALEFDVILLEAERAYIQRLYELRDTSSLQSGTSP